MQKAMHLAVLIMLSAILAACSASIEKEREKTVEEVKEIFEDQPKKTNEEIDELELRLPFRASVAEESEHNAVIDRGNDTFVLFYHRNEEAGNDVIYHMTTNSTEEEWLVNETFEEEGRFGYVLVRQVDEETYELVTGIDHVKMTTISSVGDLSKNAEWMMETVRSAKWKKTEE
ncbi:hypothetical protein [Jeotgalibacillus proteolyticus]|uniref:DUF4367 domain-containing protein n=1 Tax=Jeotgalibacillus proteolyticus TaxID=2082395 RepID=A0A2S5GF57_9BACL|nr:hypothetical protein [Jeotgalibacillus proteolyticus]PPA71677.1 hypothetical protein C4B60_06380 [Jeotgalibacillus proteolyticus]